MPFRRPARTLHSRLWNQARRVTAKLPSCWRTLVPLSGLCAFQKALDGWRLLILETGLHVGMLIILLCSILTTGTIPAGAVRQLWKHVKPSAKTRWKSRDPRQKKLTKSHDAGAGAYKFVRLASRCDISPSSISRGSVLWWLKKIAAKHRYHLENNIPRNEFGLKLA